MHNAHLSQQQQRIVALAAVFQAAQLVHILACYGTDGLTTYPHILEHTLKASLEPLSDTSSDLLARYEYPRLVRLGLRTLEGCLTQPFSSIPAPKRWRYSEALRYTTALLALERKIYTRTASRQLITQQLPTLQHRLMFFDQNVQHASMLAGMAQLYMDSSSHIRRRLDIRGQEIHLTSPQNIDRIRACLFAGVQAAHLWHELGGRRWSLFFKRRQMIEDLRMMALSHYRSCDLVR